MELRCNMSFKWETGQINAKSFKILFFQLYHFFCQLSKDSPNKHGGTVLNGTNKNTLKPTLYEEVILLF